MKFNKKESLRPVLETEKIFFCTLGFNQEQEKISDVIKNSKMLGVLTPSSLQFKNFQKPKSKAFFVIEPSPLIRFQMQNKI